MFTPRTGKGSSSRRYSSFGSTRTTRSASRRSVGIFNISNNRRRSFLTSPSINTRSPATGRSFLQSSFVAQESSLHNVESYGPSLPVLVAEALTLADRTTQISVGIDASGWAWLICGRKMLIWRFKHSNITKATMCKELALPPSELTHQARLASVIPAEDGQSVAVMAVAPEGIVRYWPNAINEGAFVEISADLNGQEGFSLTVVQSFGCILATTTNQLFLFLASTSGLQNTVTVHGLSANSGVFAKFSSFIFGSQKSSTPGVRRILAGVEEESGYQPLFVLHDKYMQKWLISSPGAEKVVYEVDLEEMIRIRLTSMLDCVEKDLHILLIDSQLTSNTLMVLCGSTDITSSPPMLRFALASVHVGSNEPPTSLHSFILTSHQIVYQEEDEELYMAFKVLLSGNSSFIYNHNTLYTCTATDNGAVFDTIEFNQPGDVVLGAGTCDASPLFFTNNFGLVTVNVNQIESSFIQDDSIFNTSSRFEQSITSAPTEPVAVPENKTQGLKTAFLQACSQHMNQAETLLEKLFPGVFEATSESNSSLDQAVAKLSQELIDDFPASDPRWAESVPGDSASTTSSLILLHQLEDKLKAHDHFISFLKRTSLWDKLHSVVVRDKPFSTRMLLCEHAEKVTAAIVLRNLHTSHAHLIDAAIIKVLQNRGATSVPSGLTHQDVFYRQVSGIHETLGSLVDYEKDMLSTDTTAAQCLQLIITTNSIFEGMLCEARQYRISKTLVYQSDDGSLDRHLEYLPWTASQGPHGMRSVLNQQHAITIDKGLPEVSNNQQKETLYQQLMEIIEILLNGYLTQLNSLKESVGEEDHHYKEVLHKYQQERRNLISPLVDECQYNSAASLAEKFCDFEILVRLCEITNDEARLQRYMNQFCNTGFSVFVFKYYMDQGKRGKLLSQAFAQQEELGDFLQSHDHLSWLHHFNTNEYKQAHETLWRLGQDEVHSMSKKKTLLSLSKLSALASDNPVQEDIDDLNTQLGIIIHQEMLPQQVLQKLNMELNEMPVMGPAQLIELYISDANDDANEFDFKKALDLLQLIPQDDPIYQELRLNIWCKAILKDQWSEVESVDPIAKCKQTVFFKTIEMAYNDGMSVIELLPDVGTLLSSQQLQVLQQDKAFQFLIKAGFEQLQRALP